MAKKLKPILLPNRYGDKNYLIPLCERKDDVITKGTYKFEGDKNAGNTMRFILGEDNKSIEAFDPSGGPMLGIGDEVRPGEKITGIVFKKGEGLIIYTTID